MKIKSFTLLSIFIVLLFSISISSAQIGIGTSQPEGLLDIENSTMGIVYPRVALTNSTTEVPVTNSNGPNLVEGTVVYNTSNAASDPNDVITDVYPGIYAWNGSDWKAQFIREDYARFEQDPGCQRVPSDIRTDIDGLDGNTFTPKYAGTYKVKVTTSFGAGEVKDLSSDTGNNLSVASAEGNFLFTLLAQVQPHLLTVPQWDQVVQFTVILIQLKMKTILQLKNMIL